MTSISNLPFVYLTSSPFSGSTLFSFLVNSHPQMATVGEMTGPIPSSDPATYNCSCGERIRECPFWKRVAERMTTSGFVFDPADFDTRIRLGNGPRSQRLLSGSLGSALLEDLRHLVITLWPDKHHRLRYLVDRNKALAANILQVAGKTVFFDASKNPMAIRNFHADPDTDLRVIHLVRDVRGVGLSRRKNHSETNWHQSVGAWIRMNTAIDRQLRRLPADRWMRIRYEDLCREPAVTMNRFFAFCGLEPHDIPRDFSSLEHHIVGNRMRLTNIGEIRLDEGWRRQLTAAEHAVAWRLAGRLHTQYGYAPMSAADIAN